MIAISRIKKIPACKLEKRLKIIRTISAQDSKTYNNNKN